MITTNDSIAKKYSIYNKFRYMLIIFKNIFSWIFIIYMYKKRVLITGGSGMLALNWACAIRKDMHVTLAMHNHSVKLRGL